MKIAVASDKNTSLVQTVLQDIQSRGHEVILFGALSTRESEADWPVSSSAAAQAVVNGAADEGVIFCWTGTGASIAANKVSGIRAALCCDAVTAQGARTYNHANVLVMSLRATSDAMGKEILDAWFATPFSDDAWNIRQVNRISEMESAKRAR